MPKQTLLEMTQNILSDMDSDEVNGIADTSEATQVATIIRTTYYDLIANRSIPEHRELFQFEGLSDSDKPTHLRYPATVTQLDWLKYDSRSSSTDTKINYSMIKYLTPQNFLDILNSRDSTASYVKTVASTSGVSLLVRNDANPTYWTSFDDDYVVCDSYDSDIDSTLQKSKTEGYGKIEPTFALADLTYPDMDVDLFPLLLSTSKAICFATLKQQNNQAASAASRSHIVRQQNNRHRLNKANNVIYPNYGRK